MIFYLTDNNFLRENICIWSEKDMYEIDVCYKIIFEAMLEKPELKSIAEKINKYTGAKSNICVRVWKNPGIFVCMRAG